MHPRYWASPETIAVNRLPMLNIEHFEKLSLDGVWRFQLLSRPTDAPRKRWSKIEVPALWSIAEVNGKIVNSVAHTEGGLPFDLLPPQVPVDNPTGVYERDFEIPGSWENKRVVLHLSGFESVARVWVNNEVVGIGKDSRLASEFDITKCIRGGKNTLRIDISKWSDGTFLEDVDHSWHGGISRSVKLYATSEVFIERLYTTAGLSKDMKSGTLEIEAFIGSINGRSREGYTFRAKVEEFPKSKSANLAETIDADSASTTAEIFFSTSISKVLTWNAETPHLYTLVFELVDPEGAIVEISSQKIGFRTVKVKGAELLVNGVPVSLRGVNRDEFTSSIGRSFSREELRQLLFELKRKNINALYTSHLPSDPVLLDLCDELGFYLISEPNLHLIPIASYISEDPRYLAAFLDRTSRHVQRDIHHPAIIGWSLGNQADSGINFETAATYLENMDHSRPLLGPLGELEIDFDDVIPVLTLTSKKASTGKFLLTNNQDFSYLSEYELHWLIQREGAELAAGKLTLPSVAPGMSAVITLKSSALTKPAGKGKRILTLIARHKSSRPWAGVHAESAQFHFSL
jgi:beta-galactosidase